MTAMAQNSELMLFITHVETDGPLLKIWGQVDRNAATCVERMILPLSEKFAQGLGAPNPSFSLPPNVICCARFQNDGYYRAKICSVQPNGNVLVHFIDYGNFEVLPPTAIRLLDNIPNAVSLHGVPPLALEFVLANVLPVNGIWEPETIESIKQSLRYADLKGILHSVVGSHRLLKLCYNNEDFGELLVSKNLALSVTLQEMFAAVRQPPRQHGPQFQREAHAQVPAGSYPPRPQLNTYAEPATRSNVAAVQEDWRSAQHRQPPAHVPEALVFKSRVLDVGSVHDVYVSFVEDGPLKFSVQVKSTAAILTQLMTDINKYPTAPLQEPPLPGSVCLGRYSLDKVLCRAVVMAVMEHKCKVYYVDFGHTEVLPYSDIFQLPPQYINPRVLSIRFTLSGLKDLDITEPIKEYFKKIVSGKPLVLQVRPPEGPPLIQYGDLYDGGINIRDLLKERCSTVAVPVFYQEPLVLKPGFKDIVHVSYVESCTKFFVQLDSRIKSLNSIMACLAEYAQKAPQLEEKRLKVGWPCCASYVEDQQWYRAKILSINGDQVTVLYVDYGNEETVTASTLRKIHDDLVTNLGAQAIRCALNGFQSLVFNQELANQLEALVLEKKLAMEVISTLPNNLMVVDLHDCSTAPMVNIATKLRIPSQLPRGTNSSNAHKDSEQILNTSRSPDAKHPSDERVGKWGRSGKPTSWGLDTRSSDWSARQNNYEERGMTKNVKDVENEQRQRESNRREGDDRFHQKEIRNNHFNRNESSGNRFERGEDTGPRRGRGGRSGSGGGVSRDDNRFDKNSSKDDSWSDRDSDNSSRSSGKRGGKGPRGIKGRGERGPRRGAERKSSTGKWSDGESDRGSQKSGQGSGFRSRERNSSNSNFKTANKGQPNKSGSWNTMSPTSPVKSPVKFNAPRIPPPNITVGAVKNAEIIYLESPTNFYVQLCPDNAELDTLMEKIAQYYGSGGMIAKSSALQPGISCIAQYSGDSKWYRATIKTNSVDTANVHFTDYGNAEAVKHDKIKELQSEFAKLSTQAVHCKLFGAAKTTWTDAEIDTFSQCAEGLSLEAEFVAQTNGIYDVLIKAGGTDGDANYVNNKFCGDLDLIQAKKELKSNVRSGGKKKTRVTPQYISAGQKWTDESFAPGYKVDVVVTWFVNPNNFYCQILSKQSEFRNMMNEIQDSYVDQQPVKTPLQVGAPVIAFFSDDGALYRAEIKELNKLRGHIVQYVDFGNCAMVDPSKIYPVEKRFTVLPKQAMHCTLKEICPVAGADWSKANKHDIDRYFDADKYKCTFHGTGDGKYSISLSNKGKDVGEAIVAAGLAANSESQAKAVVAEVPTTEASPPSAHSEKYDLTIWTGQIIRTKVSNVQGAGKFYIQIPAVTGQPAGQNQLVESYLFNVTPSSQVDNTLKKIIEGKDAIALIKIANNERFAVQLYDASGNRVKILDSDVTESVPPVCPLPIFTTNDKMWVSHIENGENIWLQRSSDSDKIAELLSSLYEYYSVSGTLLVPEVKKLCVAEAEDQNWYRASIESVRETAAVLRFIDYGNTEEVPFAKIKSLEPQFHVPHEMSLKVSLVVGLKGTDDEQKTLLHKQLDGKEFTATFYNVNSKWLVELSENGAKISEALSKQGAVVEREKNTRPEQQEIPEMIVGNRYEVFLSYSDSPAQFWLQRNEEIDAIETLQANLQEAASSFSPIVGIPEEGALCAALYIADGMWYRAEVLDADEDITTVRFVDYGNTDVLDSNSKNIKELPQSWRSIKKYGLKSRLDLIPTGSEDWSAASCEMFENMATATSEPITALIIADSVPRRVELFVGEKSVGDALVTAGHAIMVHNAEDLIDEIVDRELDPRAAFVSHVNSPSEFWVQEEKSVSDLEIMTDRFIVAEMFPKLDEISPGTLCVAKFPDDEQWYRARVNSHGAAGTQVLYIDYGNSAVSTEVRTIPDDLAAIPPLSRKCRLQLPPGVKEWSAKACDKFIDLAADGATIFLLDVIKDEETSVVGLTLDDSDVAEQLAELCDSLPVIDERLPPLGEENPPNVLVSHVNSPAEFWTQAESSIAELEIMASRLVDAQSLLPLNTFEKGTICAAKFPEDGEWYRAKIIAHDETGTNVLYFDYGNSALTTELRILPEDVANIPSLATRCALPLPEDLESWSKEACDKFVELVADGVTMFQFEILGTDDPSMIALQIDGKDVVEILRPLCEKKKSSMMSDEVIVEPTKILVAVESATFQQNEENEKANGVPENATEVIKAENVVLESEKVEEKESGDACSGGEIQTDNLIVVETEIAQIHGSDDSCKGKGVETDSSEICVTEKFCTEILETPHGTEQALATISDVVFDTKEVKINEENASHPAPAEVESADLLKTESAPDLSKTGVETEVKDEQEKIPADITESCSAIQETEPSEQISVKTAELIPEIKLEPEAELQSPEAKIATEDPICITDHSEKSVPAEIEEPEVVTVAEDAPEIAAEEVETLKELTVDEIVEKMVKTALVEVGDKVHDKDEVPEVISGAETGCDDSTKEENTGSAGEPSNNESAGTPQKTPKVEKIVPGSISRGSMDDGLPPSPLARRRSSCTDEKIVPGSINKGNDLSRAQSTDSLHQEMENASLAAPRVEAKEEPAPPTPGKCQHEDKIVPGSISRGESPSVEHARPVTPKTPHSEKLLAGVVNLQENLADFEEQDEILTVEVEDNIPKYSL